MKKIATLLVASVAAIALAGCASNKTTTTAPANQPVAAHADMKGEMGKDYKGEMRKAHHAKKHAKKAAAKVAPAAAPAAAPAPAAK